METPDELGILAELHRVAVVESLVNILWEIIANRKWNADKSAAKFLFLRYDKYFILGTNHYRSKESIEKEHTPFKFNVSKADSAASISARGYGAKLFPFHVEGTYSTLFRMTESETFSSELSDWAMKEYIDITELGRIIDGRKDDFQVDDYRSRYYMPMTKKKGKSVEKPFFLEDEFVASPLNTFIQEHNFKHFYVFVDYNTNINVKLEPALTELARIYEHADVHLYNSLNLAVPQQIRPSSGFGIHPSNWVGAITLEWRIGEKHSLEAGKYMKHYYKSEFRLQCTNNDETVWGRNDSNGSATDKFALRFSSLKPQEDWTPHVRVTIALTTNAYKAQVTDVEDKLAEHIYLRVEDDLISWCVADTKTSSKLRHMPEPARIRLMVDVLEESVKTNPESGLIISNVKSKSSISTDKALHELILQSLSLTAKHLGRLENIKSDAAVFFTKDLFADIVKDVQKDKVSSVRSTKRKKEGLIFESTVSKYLETELPSVEIHDESYTITWEDNDATITANHDLTGQGIDTLGKLTIGDRTIWLAIQSKDRESVVPAKELTAFSKTVNELKEIKQSINSKDKVISVLSLAKPKSFNYEVYKTMLDAGIFTIVESVGTKEEPVGSKTLDTLVNLLGMVID